MFSRCVTTGIAIMYVPNIAGDLLFEDYDVTHLEPPPCRALEQRAENDDS